MSQRLFTSESVTEGHPDKIADQVSDGVLDALLAQVPNLESLDKAAHSLRFVCGDGYRATASFESLANGRGVVAEALLKDGAPVAWPSAWGEEKAASSVPSTTEMTASTSPFITSVMNEKRD